MESYVNSLFCPDSFSTEGLLLLAGSYLGCSRRHAVPSGRWEFEHLNPEPRGRREHLGSQQGQVGKP